MRKFLLLALLCLIVAATALGQTASVTGRVTDASGAVVPGVRIEARNDATGVASSTESNDSGYYNLPQLLPGTYTITAEKSGFTTLRQTGLTLAVNQVARVDLTLQVGSVSESVEVAAEAVLLESESSTLGQVVQGAQVSNLPLLGRNPYALAGLVPGVRISAGANDLPVDQISTASASINGARGNQNEYLLDGAPNTAPAQNQPVVFANVDSVQEFKVETNAFSAEYGRAAGGVFNVVTKSGTNDLHFTLYEFLRNDKLNANDFFANRGGRSKAPFRFNQFGGTVGGPVVLPNLYDGRNRTFFFASTELVRFVQGVTFTGTVPRPEELAGDFSNTRNANNQLITIYDPLTTAPNPSGSGFIRQPFPGNRIPVDRMDPVARNIARYWPAPTSAGSGFTGVNNFSRTDSNRIEKNTWSARLDHSFNDNNRIFGRFSYDDSPWNRAPAYGKEFIASPSAGPQVFTRYNTVIEDTHVFSPSTLGTFRASWARLANRRRPFSDGFDITTLGFPAALKQQIGDPAAFPAILVNGLSVTGSVPNVVVGGALGATDVISFGMDTFTGHAAITKMLTRHTLKAGFEARILRFNTRQTNDQAIQFSFGPNFTQGPNPAASSATAGYGLATFLLGIAGGSITPSPALALQNTYYALYLQDDWKVTPRLTLNLGLRWDVEPARTERFNQLTNFDFNARPPLQAEGLNLRGALAFVGVNGVPRNQAQTDWNNFAPRIGFAYKVTPQTVVRGGAGLFYAATTGIGGAPNAYGISGFQAATTLVTSLDGVTPLNYLRNPYPDGLNQPTGSSLGSATLLGQNISFLDRGVVVPYTIQWNLNVQRELPGSLLLDVGYAASRGLKFQQDRLLNQLPDSALALGDELRRQVPNPFYGQIDIGPLSRPTVALAQLLRPFPHFDTVTSSAATWATSQYHSLQAKVEKRFSKGFTVLGSYTYSKLMDLATGQFSGEPLGGGAIQNWNNLAADWAVSSLDQTHRLVLNTVYELPFLRSGRDLVSQIFGGWDLGVIASAFSGGPLGITAATNNTFSQGGGQRPDWNGKSPRLDNPTPDKWFDTSVFTAAAPYRFGNAPRTFGGSRADGTAQIDLSLMKNASITEKMRLQFRAEFFNLTNTPRFGPPNISFGNPQFGVVSAQGNQPRIIQFALKIVR